MPNVEMGPALSEKDNALLGEIRAMRQDLNAALEQTKSELQGEIRGVRAALDQTRTDLTAELQSVRAEVGGLRKAVEMIAVNLLSGPEVQKVRKVISG